MLYDNLFLMLTLTFKITGRVAWRTAGNLQKQRPPKSTVVL